jgi:tetratricopeptide (TPR) repeat protein
MSRVPLICLFAVVTFAQSVRGEEERLEAERQFRFLLSRGEELRAQDDQFAGSTPPPAVTNRWNAQLRRLEGDYKRFLNQYPRHARAMVAYGDLLYDRDRQEEAVRWWERAIAVDPREAYAYNDIANHYGHYGRADKALRYYEKAIELAPTEPMFRFNWATTCQLFRNESHAVYGWNKDEIFRRSLEQFRSARDLAPKDFQMASVYAETFYQIPQPDWHEAHEAWRFCLNQPLDDRQREFVCGNLARVCIHLGRYDEAREWVAKLSSNEQDSMRRVLERKIAELRQPAGAPTATNSPAVPAPDAGGKP